MSVTVIKNLKASCTGAGCHPGTCPRHKRVSVEDIVDSAGASWYEHIPGDAPCKLYVDLDYKLYTEDANDFSDMRDNIESIVVETLVDKLGALGVTADDLALTSACGLKPQVKDKRATDAAEHRTWAHMYVLSFHVVCQTLCCPPVHMAAALHHLGVRVDPTCPVLRMFDTHVYRRGGSMRLVGMCKGGGDARCKRAVTHKDVPAAHVITVLTPACRALDDAALKLEEGALAAWRTPSATPPSSAKRARGEAGVVTSAHDLPGMVQAWFQEQGLDVTSVGPCIVVDGATGTPAPLPHTVRVRIRPGAHCPFANRTHSGNSNYFLFNTAQHRLTRYCTDADCRHKKRHERIAGDAVAFYGDYRSQGLNGTDDLERLDTFLTCALCYRDMGVGQKNYFMRKRDRDGVPLWEECQVRPFSSLDDGDLFVFNAMVKGKKGELIKKARRVEERLKELTMDGTLRHYGNDTWVPYLAGKATPPEEEDALNTFCGFRFPFRALTLEEMRTLETTTLKTFLHVFDNLVAGEQATNPGAAAAAILYHQQFVADIFQNPGEKPGVELNYRSKQGLGKDTVWAAIIAALGKRFARVNNLRDRMVSKFNGWLAGDVLIVLCSDMQASGNDTQLTDAMKSLITEPDVLVERKCKEARVVPTFMRFVRASNNNMDCTAATGRRNNTLTCGDVLPSEVYDALWSQMKPNGKRWSLPFLEALFLYFANVSLEGFRAKNFPWTQEARCQAWFSTDRNIVITRMFMALITGEHSPVDGVDMCDKTYLITGTKKALYGLFLSFRDVTDDTCKPDMFSRRITQLFSAEYVQLHHSTSCRDGARGGNTRGFRVPIAAVEAAVMRVDRDYRNEAYDPPGMLQSTVEITFSPEDVAYMRLCTYAEKMFR